MTAFKGKILMIGCGSVAQCTIPLVLELIEVPPANITIMDFVDNRTRVINALERGVQYVINRITKSNYAKVLSSYVGPGDMIIDLAWNIDCYTIVNWCRTHNVLYVNTSVEEWDPYGDRKRTDPTKYTLYARHMSMRKKMAAWGNYHKGPTAIVDHGANPGLVSHFTKQALLDIGALILKKKPRDRRRKALEKALARKQFATLAQLEGVKVIHISERDTQLAGQPKQVNEFVNTWSIEGFYEEGVAPAELGWGTHERTLPAQAYCHRTGPKNQICLSTIGMNTFVRSWVPCGEIIGMVIRHGEAFSISDRLTVTEHGNVVYRPTVHYAYCPCDAAIASLQELRMRRYRMQESMRIMNDEITTGHDELGVLLMGHDFKSWWIGSLLDIETARKLVPHQNATTLQVAISVVSAALWMLKHPHRGFCLPDDLNHEEILSIAVPYIEPYISKPVNWTPLDNYDATYMFNASRPSYDDVWQFATFQTNL